MNAAIDSHINAVVAALMPYAPTLSEKAIRLMLMAIAETSHDAGRTDALATLRTGSEAAKTWGVTRQRASAHIQRLHRQHGVGMQVGHVWLLTADEVERHRPDPHAKRPRKS